MILNITQHLATPDQINSGVVEPNDHHKMRIVKLLTFDTIPTLCQMTNRACAIRSIVVKYPKLDGVMLGGAPFFMGTLEDILSVLPLRILYAFSIRESVEKNIDGKVIKTNVFKHIGFVEV